MKFRIEYVHRKDLTVLSDTVDAASLGALLRNAWDQGWLVGSAIEVVAGASSEPATASDSTPTSFLGIRGTRWGMTREQVRTSETLPPDTDDDTALFYPATIGGIPCRLVYVFLDDVLVRAKYIVCAEHASPLAFVEDFQRIKDLLSQKYGTSEEQTVWKNKLYQDDPEDFGMAVSCGHVFQYAEWHKEGTTILLCLRGDNYEVVCAVEYSSDALSALEDEARSKRDLDIL